MKKLLTIFAVAFMLVGFPVQAQTGTLFSALTLLELYEGDNLYEKRMVVGYINGVYKSMQTQKCSFDAKVRFDTVARMVIERFRTNSKLLALGPAAAVQMAILQLLPKNVIDTCWVNLTAFSNSL